MMDLFGQFGYIAIWAFGASFLLVLLALFLFPKFKFLDRPYKYGLKRKPIPYYGGSILYIVFLACVFVFVPLSTHLIGLVVGASLIFFLGLFDDIFSLNPFLRLFVQFCAALVLVFSGVGILSINLPFFGVLDLAYPLVGALFTIFWVLAVVNTMNFIDGVSGLSSGVGFIACLAIFFLSVNPSLHENPASQIPVAIIALIVAMACTAFFLFDFPPAKILMGDSGSTFLGFIIATLSIFSGGKIATAFLVLAIPILDMIWVIIRRTLSHKKFWHGDLFHLHHRLLLDVGLSERKVVILYLFVTGFLAFNAVHFVSGQQKLFMIIGLVVFMICLAGLFLFVPKKR